MEKLYIDTVEIGKVVAEVEKIFKAKYQLTNHNLNVSLDILKKNLTTFKTDLHVVVEYPYVDKTYRDTYYNYFASKKDEYPRNTIRLSFLKTRLPDEHFRSGKPEHLKDIEDSYLGFLVIRPTFPFIIGRSLLNPGAFQDNDIQICRVKYNSTVNGIKISTHGFPHSSQDSETITCAETTVWAIMEYFGNKYAEYAPVLPSEVNEVLGRFAFERLIPSKGLTAAQISYALREIGFGVKIYSFNSYQAEFFQLLRTYVESGIPVVGLIQNKKGIGHALNVIGRKKLTDTAVNVLKPTKKFGTNVTVYDFADIDFEYVFIDDNHPPYRFATLTKPATYYTEAIWSDCEVSNFIVPLYPKIYLEAGEARKLALALIEQLNIIANKEILIKTFLTSSRSFKNAIALNSSLQADAKELLLNTPMPKFIWVTEISDKSLIMKDLATGMLILDATEPKRAGIIAAFMEGFYYSNDLTTFTKIKLSLQPFSNYQNNII